MMEESRTHFWHALTPAGVARFAHATLPLFLAQLAGALVVAASVIWFCAYNISPVLNASVSQLSENAEFSGGKLKNVSPGLLANSKFLSISVSGAGIEEPGIGDVQIVFAETLWKVCSVLGCLELPYSPGTLSLARSRAEPWLGAWQPAILVTIGAAVIVFLFGSWWALAWVYAWVPKLLSFFLDRKLTWKESRRVCRGAQVSGAIAAAVCIVLYGLTVFDLPRFLLFFSAHFIIDWIYVFIAAFFLPRAAAVTRRSNPFATAEKDQHS